VLGIGKKRARRIMKKYNIKPFKRKFKFKKRKDLRNNPAPFNNLIKNICPLKPNIIYVGDFTYIKFKSKYVYLATFMDLFTREIVGWSVSDKHNKKLVLSALLSALEHNHYQLPKTIHTDQGSEYNCKQYVDFLKYLNINVSMSKKASPWENAYQESFYSNFKTELGYEFDRFDTLGHLIEAIHKQINYHNKHRIHTTLKMTPYQFRLKHQP
jgi:transposase InsO family protein